MMGVDATARAKEMLRCPRVEAVGRKRILARENLDPARLRHDDRRALHSAIGTGAAANRVEAVAERRLETNGAAMALADVNVRIA
jgi:hypothetical protein